MRWLVVAVAALALFGCKSEDVDFYPPPDSGDAVDDVGVADGDAGEDTSGDGGEPDASGDGGEDAGEQQWAGLPCETDGDCGGAGRQCITRAFLDTLGVNPEIQIPGGMCSKLLCTGNDACGPNGLCFDASALGAPIQICLAACQEIVDCRWENDWDCMPLTVVDAEATPEDGGACVSDSLQVAIICDDGHCEEGSGEGE